MKVIPITVPFPKEFGQGRSTNAYVVKDSQTILIDTGLDGNDSRECLKKALESVGAWKPDLVLLTHGHIDHFGLCEYLHNEAGSDIMVHESDAMMLRDYKKYYSAWFDRIMQSALEGGYGEVELLDAKIKLLTAADIMAKPTRFNTFKDLNLELRAGELRTMHLPGHTAGSVGYIVGESIFSGDVAIEGTTNVTNLREEFLSLQKLKIFRNIYTGHTRSPISGADIESLEAHFATRLEDVLRATREGKTLRELVNMIYPGIEATSASASYRLILPINQTLAYLKYLEEEGHIIKQGNKWTSFRGRLF